MDFIVNYSCCVEDDRGSMRVAEVEVWGNRKAANGEGSEEPKPAALGQLYYMGTR